MKVKDLIKELMIYNPEMEIKLCLEEKENNSFHELNKCGIFKSHNGAFFYIELMHDTDNYFELITHNNIEVKE